MAAKTKTKSKTAKKTAAKAAAVRKSSISKVKRSKPVKTVERKNGKAPTKPVPKVEARPTTKGNNGHLKSAPILKLRSREYSSAIHAYESGLKLMHGENYEKAIRAFNELIAEHTGEAEILERARVLIHACEKKLHERAKAVLKSADDHYNLGIAQLNRREFDAAAQHFQQALKIAPKGDHILYAMAALNALKGSKDEALSFLKQAIQHRAENRFLAAQDSDFEGLSEDTDFKLLVTSSE